MDAALATLPASCKWIAWSDLTDDAKTSVRRQLYGWSETSLEMHSYSLANGVWEAMFSATRESPVLGQVMYRTVIVLARTHEDNYAALKLARERGIEHGSCTGVGLSKITLLCTPGEAGQYGYDLRWEYGVENHVVTDTDTPTHPSTWAAPSFRPNWERVLAVAAS